MTQFPLNFSLNLAELAWPFAIALAWIIGEFAHRWTRLPRISIYGVVGFLMANAQIGFLSHLDHGAILLFANIAFGLILFEFGYRINVRWLQANPWIGVTGLVEASATFIAVFFVAQWFGTTTLVSLIMASLSMATSPAGVLRVVNEQRSAGQVTERILHLSAINCVLAVITFQVIVMFWKAQDTGNLLQPAMHSLVVLGASVGLGALFGLLIPVILKRLGNLTQDTTVAFAFGVILLVALTHAARLSPILATLSFGLMARHRRVSLNRLQKNFGVLGDLLTVMLFVYAASTLEWQRVMTGAGLGLALFAVRSGVKILASASLAHVSGISARKGLLTGAALAPISVFVILTLEQTRYLGIAFADELAALVAMTLLLEVIGPVITQQALILARETPEKMET
jgi:Kef-type K+ transport system membrane component KefB